MQTQGMAKSTSINNKSFFHFAVEELDCPAKKPELCSSNTPSLSRDVSMLDLGKFLTPCSWLNIWCWHKKQRIFAQADYWVLI